MMVDVLYSSNHGLLTWHPVLYASVLAIPLFLKRDRRFAVLLTVAFAAQIYINGASATTPPTFCPISSVSASTSP